MKIASYIALNRSVLGWAAAGLALFVLGFFLLHGREAMHSGSWKYTLTHDDEYAFWVIADGFADSPSDGNPFYYEQMRNRNPLIAYPVVSLAGWAAAALDIPVIYLMPVWKIFAPFFTWVVLWWCLVRFWRAPLRTAGAMAMLVFVLPLFLHGPAQFAPLRFSRPLDAQWLVAIWLSIIFNPERAGRWWYAAIGASVLGAFFLSPFYAIFGVWTMGVAGVLSRFTCRELPSGRLMIMAAAGGVVALGYFFYISSIKANSPWLSATLGAGTELDHLLNSWSLCLAGLAVACVLILRRGRSWSRLDVAFISILGFEVLAAADIFAVTGHDPRLNVHRYYFLLFELLIIVGWFARSIPEPSGNSPRKRWEAAAVLGVLAAESVILLTPSINFFRHLPRDTVSSYHFLDNSFLLLELLPLLGVAVWVVRRSGWAGFAVQPRMAALLIAAYVATGYGTQPSQIRESNEDMPFVGAHEYLAQHCSPGEVLLSLPWNYAIINYAPLYSPLKLFYNDYGQRLLRVFSEHNHRRTFYTAIHSGKFDDPEIKTPEELSMKLQLVRLDYILTERGIPYRGEAPGEERPDFVLESEKMEDLVVELLGPFLTVLYEDDDCILWGVTP